MTLEELKERIRKYFERYIKPDHDDYFLFKKIDKAIDQAYEAGRKQTEDEYNYNISHEEKSNN